MQSRLFLVKCLAFYSVLFFLQACGTLSSPEYSTSEYDGGQGYSSSEFATPEEMYKNKELQSPKTHPVPTQPFSLTLPTKRLDITRGFKPYGATDHLGLDIRGRKNEPIRAAHEGIVVYAGRGFRGYGNMVLLEYNRQWATLYAHLNIINVKTGQRVKQGQKIGGMGRTGRATGVHLHFELMKDKIPIDPLPYLQIGSRIVNN